jgi:hypothetical protein
MTQTIENLMAAVGEKMAEASGAACSTSGKTKSPTVERMEQAAAQVVKELNADVLYYNGPLERNTSKGFVDVVLSHPKRKNVLLILATTGGNPDAAYLMAKCLQCNYERFTVLVAGMCKSAGTLVAIGAHDLIFSPYGELGPLDVQVLKKDELGGQTSGWAINSALNTITQQASTAFDRFFVNLIYGSEGRITVQTAGKIAADLTTGLFAPICSQVNPEFVGEVGRSLNIASQYGRMLNGKSQNLKDKGLDKLISGYASHGFVIDAYEAQNIFNRVALSEGPITELALLLRDSVTNPIESDKDSHILFLSEPKKEKPKEEAKEGAHATKPGDDGRPREAVEEQRGEHLPSPKKIVATDGGRTSPKRSSGGRKTPTVSQAK